MKIAYIICTFPPYKGGMGNSAYHFARQLVEAGDEVTVFTADYKGGGSQETVDGIMVRRLRPFFAFGNAAILPSLVSELNGFDIVHLHYPFFGAVEFVILANIIRKKQKLVVHYHMDTIGSGLKGVIFNLERFFILPIILRLANRITVGSLDYVANSQVNKYFIHHKQKFFETLFGVDVNKFRPDFANKKRNVLFVAGLDKAHYFKGLNVLLDAMKKVKELSSDMNIILDVVGDGDLRPEYENYAKQIGVSEMVKFHGSLSNEDLAIIYGSSGVFVLPSINQGEAFGLVLLEAMASGTAAIATDLPGVRQVFNDNKQGFLVPVNDSKQLANRILQVLDNKMFSFGLSARALVEEKYTWESVGKRLKQVYNEIL